MPAHDHGASHLEHVSTQMSAVLDPLAARCVGRPVEEIRQLIMQDWPRHLGSEFTTMALTDTALALREGRPWCAALWTTGPAQRTPRPRSASATMHENAPAHH